MRPAIFTDFDGTITTRDSLDALVDHYIGAEGRTQYDKLFLEGDQALWQVLDTSLKACDVTLNDAIRFLRGHVAIDPTFAPFHAWCEGRGIPLAVVSAGVYEIVQAFLTAAGLHLPIEANRAACSPTCFGLTPQQADCPTGVDKGGIVRRARAAGHYTVFIGDGFSDRLAVGEADLVYAKAGLARYCAKRAVPFVPFDTFADVQGDLDRRFAAATPGS
jgi:2,3-diketo-5-methylthio-1-phosphopentane phosphatase